MKKIFLAGLSTAALMTATAALADDHEIKIGVILGFSGPLESITPAMGASGELAMKEVSESGAFLGGKTVTPVRADSTCIDAAAATSAAERLLSSEGVAAIFGPDCSGVTTAVVNNVTVPQGVINISPSATSPALSSIEDNGLFFRTSPSDARQGAILAQVVMDRGIDEVAVTFTNNDYGKGFADAFVESYKGIGGTVTLSAAHEDGRADYSAEVGALSAAGGDALVVLGYIDQGGLGVMRSAIDTGAFDVFVGGDGMYGTSLLESLGDDLETWFGTLPGSAVEGDDPFVAISEAAGIGIDGPYVRESYDAAALLLLAMQAAGEATGAAAEHVMAVANAPGEKIAAGELARGLELLAAGTDIDYVGASGVELIEPGESTGVYREYELVDGALKDVRMR
ncbi:ABC transporter substrate-binding protein [Pararhizobium sp. IMCC21322]|uniref:ABC transporter substrate-binding protein n=1 Tax=Pararhizobium sp. IMCC21322 TaxID=3067903 RepID=UPI00274031F6|nr:ABC transporter substrate-binding protein [Pararhizobium sp. IMCC21322]